MTLKQFKVGDFVSHSFKLSQILEMEGNRVTSVSDGYGQTSSYDMEDLCFPLSMKNMQISNSVKYVYDELHKLKVNGLNFPDLVRELERRWALMCEAAEDKMELKNMMESLSKFLKDVQDAVEGLRLKTVGGIPIMRRV